jgi:hypothetical protein
MDYSESLDRYGYYIVCGKKYYNKLEAFKVAFEHGYHPHWYFHEDTFESFDWTVEPSQSLSTLYAERAREIREKYDHIVLAFSGGSDSSTIADTFINNNIKLDYVFNRTALSSSNRRDNINDEGNLHNETIYSAYPQFLKYKEKQPWLEWIVWDYAQWIVDEWGNNPLVNPYETNSYMPNVLLKRKFNQILPNLEGRKVAFIVGIDKPFVFYKEGKFYLSFLDEQMLQQISDSDFYMKNNIVIEPFYWSKSCSLLIAKQAHIIKKFFKNNPEYLKHISKWPERCDADLYRQITLKTIYSPDKINLWQPKKGSYKWIYTSEDWFHNCSNTKAFNSWKGFYNAFETEARKIFERDDSCLWVQNKGTSLYKEKVFNGLPGCYSKLYNIGE